MPLDPATVAHRWFEEAWNQGSERAIDELHVTVEDTITQGEKVAIRIVLEATHLSEGLGVPASNARVKISGIIIARVVNGQIAEAWNNWDQFALLQQINAIPAPKPADRFLSAQI